MHQISSQLTSANQTKTNVEENFFFFLRWQMRKTPQPHQLEACFRLILAKLARTDGGMTLGRGGGWGGGVEGRSVPAVLTAPDLYNHHAKALKSQPAALSHAPHARSTCTRTQTRAEQI